MKYEHPEVRDTRIFTFIVEDRYRVLRHVVVLVGMLFVIFYSNGLPDYPGAFKYYRLFCVYITLVIMFYINMNVLVPRFFFKGRYILYGVLLLLLVMFFLSIMSYLLKTVLDPAGITVNPDKLIMSNGGTDSTKIRPHWNWRKQLARGDGGIYEGTIILMAIIMVSTMTKLFQRWMIDNKRMTELRNLTLRMELNELRNQINPHFLFNMLNGIKALVRSDQEKATHVIMKLSEFLRYQLYENNDEKILLKSEINFLTNFLDLEKLRRDHLSIHISSHTEARIINSVFLPPNLFTSFVENAVKHSVNVSGAPSFIRVNIEVNEGKLYFNCVNSKDPAYKPSHGKNSGLGLANIKRRLELLYGDQYNLDITSTEQIYDVELTIPV